MVKMCSIHEGTIDDPDTRQHLFSALENLVRNSSIKDYIFVHKKDNYIDSLAPSPNVSLIQPEIGKVLQGSSEGFTTWSLRVNNTEGANDRTLKLYWTGEDIKDKKANTDQINTLCYNFDTKKYSVTTMDIKHGNTTTYGDYNVLRFKNTVGNIEYDTYEEALAAYKAAQ
ncbi:MAG TPA: hypothetical protein VJY37_00135 [Anaerovoracaceae bacterium]|nr:hypothetical protein [Anaerovoracaceae bacterium]